jgi:hypothetical protein
MESRRSICRLIAIVSMVAIAGSPFAALRAADDQKAADPKAAEPAVVLRGIDGKTIRLSREELQKLPRTEIEAADHRGNKSRYAGVSLRTLLDKLKVPRGEGFRGEWMRAFVVVEATDDYRAIFAIPELDPGFTDRVIFLADTRDGHALEKYKGPFQVIVPGEKRQARWVRMVKEIRLVDSRALDK